ncbi:hypothetical protein [Amycolatopsis acididurans]|uniref:hypothetical protein n=1 Tax=Amycolatopsis acididurans TaxID=2724524 RepID=UPI001B32CD71|nr:hypothetical protein [Amycolatopsis acididurans]
MTLIRTPFGFGSTAAGVANIAATTGGDAPRLHGVARYALDAEGARRLWTLSETLLEQA